MPLECEAKLPVAALDPVREALDVLGATNEGDYLERNWILDDADGSLRQKGVLLRVRNMGGADAILTVKREVTGGEFKTREETETMVDSAKDLLVQMEAIGFGVAWIYEKFRQTWLWRECIISLDECPEIGCFVEIEGTPDRIREAAGDLRLDLSEHIDDSYLGLWIRHLRETGSKPRNMVFSREGERNRRFHVPKTTRITNRNDG